LTAGELDEYATELVAVATLVVPEWIERCFRRFGVPIDEHAHDAACAAGEEVTRRLGALLALDAEAQPTTPLSVLRDATLHATGVLAAAGVEPVRRDEMRARSFPDDVYDLAPATWSDVDERLHEPGLRWGASKARAVIDRHRRPA
jgi:hypothetical protein